MSSPPSPTHCPLTALWRHCTPHVTSSTSRHAIYIYSYIMSLHVHSLSRSNAAISRNSRSLNYYVNLWRWSDEVLCFDTNRQTGRQAHFGFRSNEQLQFTKQEHVSPFDGLKDCIGTVICNCRQLLGHRSYIMSLNASQNQLRASPMKISNK